MDRLNVHCPGGDQLVTYPVGDAESIPVAIVEAFRTLEPDNDGRDTVLADWIKADALVLLFRKPNRNLRVSTVVWNHPVVITPEEIRIYSSTSDDHRPKDVST